MKKEDNASEGDGIRKEKRMENKEVQAVGASSSGISAKKERLSVNSHLPARK